MQVDTNDFKSVRNILIGLGASSIFYCGTVAVADAAVATFVTRFWSAQ